MEKKLLSGAFLCLLAAGASAQHPTIGGYNVYYGHLHNHSTVSDATGTPATAYNYAKNTANLDFFSLADHSNSISSTEWTDVMNQANAYNQDGVFTTFYGFEWSSGGNYGHVAVINTDDYCTTSSPTNTFAGLVTWLASRPNGIAFCNHPGREDDKGLEFSHFTTTPSNQFVGMELWNKTTAFDVYYYNDGYYRDDYNKSYFDEANSRGWRIGASGSSDNHSGTWGTAEPYRLAILADTLRRADLLAAMQARRFFSTLDKNLSLSFKMGGAEMGSSLEGRPYNIQIQARDKDGESFTKVMLFRNGYEMKTWVISTPEVDLSLPVSTFDGDFFYIKVSQSDGDEAISSPIYIKGGVINIHPSCSISAPENGIHFDTPQSITIAAEASDTDGSVASVEFFVNGNSVGSDALAPYFINYTIIGDGPYSITAKVTDDVGSWTTSPPITFTVGTFSVICSSRISNEMDDIEEKGDGSMDVGSSDIELVYDGSNQKIGLRFTGLNIPPGAAIKSASIQFTVDEVSSGTCKLYIKGHNADNSEPFTSAVNNVSGRLTTSAVVTWEPAAWPIVGAAGTDQRTPDLSSIIQDIVNRSGYTQSSAISIIITGTGERTAEAYEGAAGSAALLTVNYTVGMVTSILAPAFDETHVRIYPNPVSNGKVTVEINGGFEDGATVTVFDIYGRICHLSQIEKSETVIDLSGIKSGLYIIKLSNNNKVYSYKLLVE